MGWKCGRHQVGQTVSRWWRLVAAGAPGWETLVCRDPAPNKLLQSLIVVPTAWKRKFLSWIARSILRVWALSDYHQHFLTHEFIQSAKQYFVAIYLHKSSLNG